MKNIKQLMKQPVVSVALVVINILIFFYSTKINRGLEMKGVLDAQRIMRNGEYYRILTSMFLHANLTHIVNNMIILFFMGSMLEEAIGHIPILLIYFGSGIGAGCLSLAYKVTRGSMAVSLGASGAIFGLDGLLLALVLLCGKKVRSVSVSRAIAMVVFSVYSGFTEKNIDNAAHIGGLMTGFLLGIIYCTWIYWREERKGQHEH